VPGEWRADRLSAYEDRLSAYEDRLSAPGDRLSPGEQQRLQLARVFWHTTGGAPGEEGRGAARGNACSIPGRGAPPCIPGEEGGGAPPLVFLDECTSAVDEASERRIFSRLRALRVTLVTAKPPQGIP